MANLLLTTQVQALKKNLERVQDIRDTVRKWRSDMLDLQKLLGTTEGSIQSSVRKAEGYVRRAYEIARDLEISVDVPAQATDDALGPPTLEDLLDRAGREIKDVEGALKQARQVVQWAQMRSVQIGKTNQETELERVLRNTLMLRAGEMIKQLDEVSRLANEGKTREAWQLYDSGPYKGSQEVFSEYLDLLIGLVLRDSGFDEGICRIADELIVQDIDAVGTERWRSLTIPARHEALKMTMARIIRLGFPEWTVWTLPLTAHEFGHVVVSIVAKLHEYVKEQAEMTGITENHLQELLADGFAAYTMGPAYAYAAILLRLNPLRAFQEGDQHPADRKRAHVIFTMLRMRQNPVKRPYDELLQTLSKEWEDAIQQAQQPQGQLDVAEAERLDGWVAWLQQFLDDADLPDIPWDHVQKWKDQFLEGTGETIPQGVRWRDVLNAAWAARMKQPEKADGIWEQAKALWRRSAQPGQPGPGGQRRAADVERQPRDFSQRIADETALRKPR